MRRFINYWDQFWFSLTNAKDLAVLRIAIGSVFFMNRTGMDRLFREPLPNNIIPSYPYHLFKDSEAFILDTYRLPYPWLEAFPPLSFETFQLIELVMPILAILLILGLYTRITAPLCVLLFATWFFQSQFIYKHGHITLLISMSVLCISPCNHYYSLDRYFSKTKEKFATHVSRMHIRMLQAFCSILHFSAGAHKVNMGWYRGEILELIAEQDLLRGPLLTLMVDWKLYVIGSWFTVISFLFIGVGFWFEKQEDLQLF